MSRVTALRDTRALEAFKAAEEADAAAKGAEALRCREIERRMRPTEYADFVLLRRELSAWHEQVGTR